MSLLVRAVIMLSGAGLLLLEPRLALVPAVVVALAVVLCAVVPLWVGSLPAVAAFVGVWLAQTGWGATPDVWRTAAAALLLFVLHASVSLAAGLPRGARVDVAVVRRFAVRCAAPAGVAAVVVAVDLALPSGGAPAFVELAGLAGVLIVAAIAARPLWRR